MLPNAFADTLLESEIMVIVLCNQTTVSYLKSMQMPILLVHQTRMLLKTIFLRLRNHVQVDLFELLVV